MAKDIIVVGDRVLLSPTDDKEKTARGLYLPPGVEKKEKLRAGYVVKTGPGYPLPDASPDSEEPWHESPASEPRYLPVQAQEGDYAVFLRKSSVEIEVDGSTYLIVPHSAILVLIRDDQN